jgi:hypothetical protein
MDPGWSWNGLMAACRAFNIKDLIKYLYSGRIN